MMNYFFYESFRWWLTYKNRFPVAEVNNALAERLHQLGGMAGRW